MSETILMVKGHMTKWQAFYVMVIVKIIIAVVPIWLMEFMLHKQFNEIDGPTWACLCLNTLLQGANCIDALMNGTYDKSKSKSVEDTKQINFTTINK